MDEKLGIAGGHVGGHLQAELGSLVIPGGAQHPGLVAQHPAEALDFAGGHHAFEQDRHHLVKAPGHLALQAAAGLGPAGAADGREGRTHDFFPGLQVPVLEAGTGQQAAKRVCRQVLARGQRLGGRAWAGQHRLHGAQRGLYVRLLVWTGRSRAVTRFLQNAKPNLQRHIA